MKKIKLSVITIILLFLTANISPLKSSAQAAVNFQVFYDGLSPYGNWITYPGYGYVWSPNAGPDFRPYVTGGHWVYSDAGWVWASDYDWGWAPFHYGSWISDPTYGWLWVPGYDWAPAWVTWGSYNGYYGWAPVSPGFSIGVGYYPSMDRWCFVEPRYMAVGGFGDHYYVARGGRISIGGGIVITNEHRITTFSNRADYGGHGYYAGPPREEFERVSHTRVTPVAIRESNSPGRAQVGGNAINVYRPRINPGTKVYSRPAKATPNPNTAGRQDARNNGGRPANQQTHPSYQQPQRTVNNAPVPSRGNNSAPVQRQPQAQQQHNAAPQQRAQPAQQQQHTSRPAAPAQHQQQAQPQQRQQQAPRQEAPRGGEQREEGRPK